MVNKVVNSTVDGTFRQTNLTNESAEYLEKREQLRLAEIELMKQRERVAELRRHLPEGATVEDYDFEEGPHDLNSGDSPVSNVRLSELFTKSDRSLVIYHFMYGKKNSKACPMCTAWIDGVNGIAHHLAQKLDFALVAAADVPTLRAFARERGWDKLRLLSAAKNTFKFDFGSENPDGGQDSTLSVFTRGCRRRRAPLLYRASMAVARDSRARHRLALSDLAFPRPHPAGPRQLVHKPRLRHESPGRIEIIDRVGLRPLSNNQELCRWRRFARSDRVTARANGPVARKRRAASAVLFGLPRDIYNCSILAPPRRGVSAQDHDLAPFPSFGLRNRVGIHRNRAEN